jgi:2'-5' RNA ligase
MTERQESLYFIALVPPEPIRSEVLAIKQTFATQYQSKAALRSPAHITLQMPFKMNDLKVHSLKLFLQTFSSTCEPFFLEIQDFSCFVPKVIFLDVKPSSSIVDLQKKLSRELQVNFQLFHSTHKNNGFTPHMTVAFRDLKPARFREAWEVYQKVKKHYAFEVDRLSLLKHNGRIWEIDQEFLF